MSRIQPNAFTAPGLFQSGWPFASTVSPPKPQTKYGIDDIAITSRDERSATPNTLPDASGGSAQILSTSSVNSCQVVGGLSGSSPARLNRSRL